MGGDELEDVQAVMDSPEDRTQQISEPRTIRVWSKFTFPGRNGAYSKFTWNQQHFSGADWDELTKQKGFPCFRVGKRVLINRDMLQAWLDEQCSRTA